MTTNRITLDHGSGGEASQELIEDIFLSRLDNAILRTLDDSAVLDLPDCSQEKNKASPMGFSPYLSQHTMNHKYETVIALTYKPLQNENKYLPKSRLG
jgi:hypothetical protein